MDVRHPNRMIPLGLWILKSILILAIFHLAVPSLADYLTRNSWIKLPVFVLLSVCAGIFMGWMHYVPWLLLPVWLVMSHYSLNAMQESTFEARANLKMSKPVFYTSRYSYVILSCVWAWVLQMEIVTREDPSGPGVFLWKRLLGLE